MKTQTNVPRFILICLLLTLINGLYGQGWSVTISNYGSDYNVRANYDSDAFCQCNDNYIFTIYKSSVRPSNYMGGKSGSSDKGEVTFVVGPNKSYNYVMGMKVEGKNKFIFDCAVSCTGTGEIKKTVKTTALKRPITVRATDGEDAITLTWKKGTNIPEKNAAYWISRGNVDNIIAKVSGSTYEYIDKDVGPGETHTYYIRTRTESWGKHTSSSAIVTGSTRDREARATVGLPKKVTISWDDVSKITDEVIVRREGEQIATVAINSSSDTSYSDSDPSLIPGFLYNYAITWIENDIEYVRETKGSSQPNGRIRGKVVTPTSQIPVEGVIVCAELIDSIPGDKPVGYTLCDTTDANGNYDIRKLYYYQEANFKVSAYKEGHGFDPAFYDKQLLDLDIPTLNRDFKDTTSFFVSGYVNQYLGSQECGIEEIEIWVNGIFKGVTTDKDGFYEFLVEESGTYTIEPRFSGHEFVPNKKEILVTEETTGVNFEDTKTNFIEGKVLASCDIYIGKAMVRVYSEGGTACIDTLLPTNEIGIYKAVLPARKYEVEVVSFEVENGLNIAPDAVISYFKTESADLTNEGQIQDFVYREPPSITVAGFPTNNCDNLGYAVVDQEETYYLDIEVREAFGDDSCPVETGYVLIYNEISDRANEPDSLPIVNGLVTYELTPGYPNLIAPYRKVLQIEAFVEDENAQWSEEVVVTGLRPREQTFTTVSPEIPFMILHDPPGDASSSYLEKNNTTSLALRMFGKKEGSISTTKTIKTGFKVSQMIIPGTSVLSEAWGEIGATLTVGASISGSSEWILSLTSKERFKTSGNQQITGDEGDVFVGAAMNLVYAQVDILEYDPSTCDVTKDIDIIMGNDGFATTFMYTEEHISKTLIPQLSGIRDFYEGNNADSAAIYDNQIAVWKQILDQNAKNKSDATFIENRSFSAGADYTSSVTTKSENSLSIEGSVFVEKSAFVESGFETSNTGGSGKVEARVRFELGASATGAIVQEKTAGFELKDDDPGDFFSVDIKKDPVYGTPVFGLVSGRSSCPWEAGTQPRETVQLQSDAYSLRDVPENEAADFQLSLGNISQSDETRTYLLRFLQETNPDGAEVRIGGSEAQNAIPYTIGAGQQRGATVTIRKGPRATSYEGLKFVLSSGCNDDNIADTVALNVSFKSAYPAVVLEEPKNNWLVNQGENNELLVWFRNYDKDRLKKIQVQYSPKDRYEWVTGQEWQPANISSSPSGMAVKWDVSNVPEGSYDIRMRADYGDADTYSSIVTGLFDREAPRLFGLPEPSDGEWVVGDIIEAKFNENISCFGISSENVEFKSMTTGKTYPVEVGCAENTLLIRPLWNANDHINELIAVRLDFITDMNDNTSTEPFEWQFTIGDADGTPIIDTDKDGVPDASDNCPLAANPDQQDVDGDGIGDICDDDIDDDQILNADDNCPYFANPDQRDNNGNGIGDLCEPDSDGDGDGITNEMDNCPLVANPDQKDTDQDGIGDTCDEDIDGDGVPNAEDNCPTVPNPDQLESSIVGVGEACSNVVSTQEEKLGINRMELIPNPAVDQVQLQMDLQKGGTWQVVLYHANGQQMSRIQELDLSAGASQFTFDLSQLAPGLYLVRAISEQGTISRKLVLSR